MDAELDRLVHEASLRPLSGRAALFEKLLGSGTFLLQARADAPPCEGGSSGTEAVSIWAEGDPDLGGVWVPVFTSLEELRAYARRKDSPVSGSTGPRWIAHSPGQVYSVLQSVPRFAGVLLNASGNGGPVSEKRGGVRLEWSEVNALSEGRIPPEAPTLRVMPAKEFCLPYETRCRVGRIDEKVFGFRGRQLVFPEHGSLTLQDFRFLAELEVDDEGPVWTPCRHIASVARAATLGGADDAPERRDSLLSMLGNFEMYGEAEALCDELALETGQASRALARLSTILRRSGRIEACISVCRTGLREHPGEEGLYRDLVLAHAQMEDLDSAKDVARRGLRRFPRNETLLRFL